jgi:hypothetical protein
MVNLTILVLTRHGSPLAQPYLGEVPADWQWTRRMCQETRYTWTVERNIEVSIGDDFNNGQSFDKKDLVFWASLPVRPRLYVGTLGKHRSSGRTTSHAPTNRPASSYASSISSNKLDCTTNPKFHQTRNIGMTRDLLHRL